MQLVVARLHETLAVSLIPILHLLPTCEVKRLVLINKDCRGLLLSKAVFHMNAHWCLAVAWGCRLLALPQGIQCNAACRKSRDSFLDLRDAAPGASLCGANNKSPVPEYSLQVSKSLLLPGIQDETCCEAVSLLSLLNSGSGPLLVERAFLRLGL